MGLRNEHILEVTLWLTAHVISSYQVPDFLLVFKICEVTSQFFCLLMFLFFPDPVPDS